MTKDIKITETLFALTFDISIFLKVGLILFYVWPCFLLFCFIFTFIEPVTLSLTVADMQTERPYLGVLHVHVFTQMWT